ncbi:MAG TPA: hypothetical protein ENN67_05860, partial [Firmicutes bacterium]|nr:hypothetical protein [Bacillota bacterium]
MRKVFQVLGRVVLPIVILAGCSSGNHPVIPEVDSGIENMPVQTADGNTNTHLWGYYDVFIDIENLTVEAVENRKAMFTANVVNFINSMPAGLTFQIHGTKPGPGYIDVDIDVSIMHPFPGMTQFNGYDVRGVFMGDGFGTLNYNSKLKYPVDGIDQLMLPDPVDGIGGPDGYTRWFNKPEFSMGGMPLLQYTQGHLATPTFNGTATLNAYKYFADGLISNADLWGYLSANPGYNGKFSSGSKNTRNYYLRFPDSKGVKYGYAITANWEGPDIHPSNAPESVACKVNDSSTVWYVDSSQNGGKLILDISLWNWGNQPSKIFIESTVLSSVYELTSDEMVPFGGNEHYSTWHVEIPADNVTGLENQEYWVISQHDEYDYTNEFGVNNLAGTDKLAALFRCPLTVLGEPVSDLEVISPNGGEILWMAMSHEILWDTGSSGISNVKIEWSTDNFQSDVRTIVESTPNDGSYMWVPIPNVETDTARVRVSDVAGSGSDTSDGDFTIALPVWLKFQDEVEVSNSTVSFATWTPRPYEQWLDEFSTAISQDSDGMAH